MQQLETSRRSWPRGAGIAALILSTFPGEVLAQCGELITARTCILFAGQTTWNGECFDACSTGGLTSVSVDIDSTSVVPPQGQAGLLMLGEAHNGVPVGPGHAHEIHLYPGRNVLRLTVPFSVVGGSEYYFALYADDLFVWPMTYCGLCSWPFGTGAFAANRDWTLVYPQAYCHFGFEAVILPPSATTMATWGLVKALYRDTSN